MAKEGRTIGHYVIGKTIGEGTFGKVRAGSLTAGCAAHARPQVKLGTHVLSGEKVAIKVLDKSKIVEIADVQRVTREIKILKRNRHSNVVQLFEVLDTPRTIFLIMEHADRYCRVRPPVHPSKFRH
jgi:serine/threonine protein kinase